jgi:hypothetical protein
VLKFYLHGKTSYIENFVYNAKLLAFSTICIENLFGIKNWLHLKTSYIKKLLQTSQKKKNHKKYGIGSLHICVHICKLKVIIKGCTKTIINNHSV